jgi:hypothetical protein
MQFPLRAIAALLLAVAAAGCDSPTGDNTRNLPPLAAGASVQGSIEAAAADSFALVIPDAEFRVLLRATSGSVADTLVASVITETGNAITLATSVGTDTDITAQSTAWLLPPAGAEWRVEVRGKRADDAGGYEVQLFTRNAAPERRPAALTLGAAVEGEALEVPGDVDEFTLDGAAGDEWIVFAQSNAAPGVPMGVEVVERTSGEVIVRATPAAPSAALESQSTGRFVLPRAGTYLVRVAATAEAKDVRGPYRLRVDRVNRAPETRGGAAALGDVLTETIGSVGDVDEFTFTSPAAGQEVNVLVQLQQGMTAGLRVQLLRFERVVGEVVVNAPAASLDEAGVGRVALEAAGPFTVRVMGEGQGTPTEAAGAYRLELYPVDPRAEAGGQVRVDGGAVTDAIDRPGDVDEYTVAGTAGQLLVVHVDPSQTAGALLASLVAPNGSETTSVVGTDEHPGYSKRLALPVTGTYRLRVGSAQAWVMGKGAYRVETYTIDPAPEHVPAVLTIGQTITAERIDRPGDYDVFTFTGQVGRTVNLFLGVPNIAVNIVLSVRKTTDPFAFIYAFGGTQSLDGWSTGRIATENASYVVTVDPWNVGTVTNPFQGAYGLRLFEIDRRPEGRSAAYVMGDTVTGEPLYPSGDIDDYRFELSATTPVRVYWNTEPFADPTTAVFAQLYDENSGGIVWTSANGDNNGPVRQFTLPAGRYRLAILNWNLNAPSETAKIGKARLDYGFALIPQ